MRAFAAIVEGSKIKYWEQVTGCILRDVGESQLDSLHPDYSSSDNQGIVMIIIIIIISYVGILRLRNYVGPFLTEVLCAKWAVGSLRRRRNFTLKYQTFKWSGIMFQRIPEETKLFLHVSFLRQAICWLVIQRERCLHTKEELLSSVESRWFLLSL